MRRELENCSKKFAKQFLTTDVSNLQKQFKFYASLQNSKYFFEDN